MSIQCFHNGNIVSIYTCPCLAYWYRKGKARTREQSRGVGARKWNHHRISWQLIRLSGFFVAVVGDDRFGAICLSSSLVP